ncbi:hypothetical protein EJ08DRAFT_652002 [Tothia fuscella]|uniref:Cell wall mannoprotein 1 n=1 Tax=Tothia fuscella TaxID=1048955 RepID=A0A9P4TVC9_9PEZI|nr:hypothetical protein EJ08DRAFT_652002 [Tothia fuscella]
MKLLDTIAVFSSIVCAIAEPIINTPSRMERDLPTIESVLSSISSQVDTFDAAVKSFSGDPQPALSASDQLLTLINSGTTIVMGTSPLTLLEAAQVSQSVQTLNTSVASVVNDLIAQKCPFVTAGQGTTVLAGLQNQKTAAQALANAITSKVPDELKGVAAELSAGIADSLQRGINAYTDTSNCGGSGSPTTAPPEQTTPPTSSTSVPPTLVPTNAPSTLLPTSVPSTSGPSISIPPPTTTWGNYTKPPGHTKPVTTSSHTTSLPAPPGETLSGSPPGKTSLVSPPGETVHGSSPHETLPGSPPVQTLSGSPPGETPLGESPPPQSAPESPSSPETPSNPGAPSSPEAPSSPDTSENPPENAPTDDSSPSTPSDATSVSGGNPAVFTNAASRFSCSIDVFIVAVIAVLIM